MTEQTAAPAATDTAPVTEPAPAQLPPMPLLPPLPPPPAAPRPPRRVLRAVARWTAAVLVLGGVGAGTAYGITSMERTEVPGLATEGDGRWEYPRLSLPALPAGAPRPFHEGNTAEVHHADLRKLLLPAPAGATADKKLTGGWVSTQQFVSEYDKEARAGLGVTLRDAALRHIAARGWTMPDGTSSRIYLLQFNSTADADAYRDERSIGSSAGDPLAGAAEMALDESWAGGGRVVNTSSYVFSEQKPFGAAQARQGYLVAGDTVALVVQSRKGGGGTPRIPFHQTLILQNQLLG
ncbi:hypothetical protein [Streptomyces sp. NBC_00338]|uniref:hypothetical protein n=1 Tax=Streptomyces sp. NBC_00338 TaxID=2975715 RepID=UPI00224CFD18|nr:hypothetical protein [Streptomyces sp. NBC_00338]MCX5141738.1 hypothetical protein [Streptomyces sp. NBC_00338]